MGSLRILLEHTRNDSPDLARIKGRVRSWFILNLSVLLVPWFLRALVWVFAGELLEIEVFNLEEVFFFSLFAAGSALSDVWHYSKTTSSNLEWGKYFFALLLVVFFMAATYSLAFSGLILSMGAKQSVVVVAIIVAGLLVATRSQLQMVNDSHVRQSGIV